MSLMSRSSVQVRIHFVDLDKLKISINKLNDRPCRGILTNTSASPVRARLFSRPGVSARESAHFIIDKLDPDSMGSVVAVEPRNLAWAVRDVLIRAEES